MYDATPFLLFWEKRTMKNETDLLTIGETARALGVTRRILLHYEERGLIQPDVRRGDGGNRYYSIDTFTQLRNIRNLQNLGLTLDEIREYFRASTDLMPLIRRLEEMRDTLDRNIEKLYERARTDPPQIRQLSMPPETVYRRAYRSDSVAERAVLLRNTALEALRLYGTDVSRRMYFIEYAIGAPADVAFCVAVPPSSRGQYVTELPAARALCVYHHGPYEDLPAVARQLIEYATTRGLSPLGTVRHTYLEGPPQHKDPAKFITQLTLPVAPPETSEI